MECCGNCNKCTNGKCVCDDDRSEKNKEYRKTHIEILKSKQKRYYEKHKEQILKNQKESRKVNNTAKN